VVNTEDYDRGTEGGEEEAVSPTMHAWDLGGFWPKIWITRQHANELPFESNDRSFEYHRF